MDKFKLRREAEKDLETIWQYTAKNWSVNQADYYIDGLVDMFALLAENPLMCRERNEFTPSVHIHHHAHHLVVFMPFKDGIDIVRVLHESMDIVSHLD